MGFTEAEYKAIANAIAQVMCVQSLLNELGIQGTQAQIFGVIILVSLHQSANSVILARTKHIDSSSEGSKKIAGG
jgi:hypothetical protein